MKKMKRLAALFLAVVMVMAMGMTAMATEGDGESKAAPATTYTITLTTAVPTGHTYKIYQIFTGTVSTDGKTLSNIAYGASYTGVEGKTAVQEAKEITDANTFAEGLILPETAYREMAAGETTLSGLPGGYYLIKDVSTASGKDEISHFMVNILGNVTIAPKTTNVPGFEKTIAEKDAFSYAAGENVPFALTATLPKLSDNEGNAYTAYKLVFTDELSENLAFNGDVTVVYKNGDNERSYDADKYSVTTDGQKITVTMTNALVDGVVEGTKVIVKYTAKLSENAISGEVAKNTAKLEYGNNGDNQGGGTTESSEVKLYNFKLDFNKTKEDGTALEGAGFTLSKKVGENWVAVGSEISGINKEGKINYVFDGLSAGDYKLEETTVPDGYNKMEDLTFTISAELKADKTVDVSSLGVEGWNNTTDKFTFTADVKNIAGIQLPSTGGIGTTIFYVVGGILVLGAGVLLITKKRMSARD